MKSGFPNKKNSELLELMSSFEFGATGSTGHVHVSADLLLSLCIHYSTWMLSGEKEATTRLKCDQFGRFKEMRFPVFSLSYDCDRREKGEHIFFA